MEGTLYWRRVGQRTRTMPTQQTVTTQPAGGADSSSRQDEGATSSSASVSSDPQMSNSTTNVTNTSISVHRDLGMAPFVPQSDPDETGRAWATWKREFCSRLRYFRIAPEDKFDALTIYGGSEIRELLDNLVLEDTDFNSTSGPQCDFETAIPKLDEYFDPLINKDSARNKFENMSQTQSESVAEYYVRLKTQARKCQFADCNDTIRSKLLQTMNDKRLRREAMTKSYTLKQLLEQAAHKEAIERQAKSIEAKPSSSTAQVKMVHSKAKYHKSDKTKFHKRKPSYKPDTKPDEGSSDSQCPYCGGTHAEGRSNCPASGKRCLACGKLGHFASACLNPRGNSKSRYSDKSTKHGGKKEFHSKDKKVNYVAQSQHSESEDEYAFSINSKLNDTNVVTVTINGIKGKAHVDSCATANIMSIQHFNAIKRLSNVVLQPTNTKVYAYAQKNPISLEGEFHTVITSLVTNKSVNAKFLVAKGPIAGHPLLSMETSSKLELVQIVHKVASNIDDLKQKYSTVFEGLGCHNKITAKLLVDDDIEPIAHKRRKIPYHLEQKAAKEEERLIELGVLERVPDNTPTTWCSNPVIVPKPNSDKIRYCSDMRVPNTAIKRPVMEPLTVEDIKIRLNGATVFSVLDMNEGYHQLQLDPDSRHLTTFHGVNGKMRYKRLNYGTISAQDVFDKAMDNTISDLNNVMHIRDDFICFGKTQKEHDEALESLLKRFEECGLTFNARKCKLSVPEIEFFGFKFSNIGIQPSANRITALQNMPAPKSAAEVRSLLGMAQYSASFIKNFSQITAPLRALTHKNAPWKWEKREQDAFSQLKTSLSDDSVLGYFETGLPTKLQVDAGPHGLGLILLQLQSEQWKPVFCASRSLTDVETRYSQTEREALAIRWGCERCYLYLIGTDFVVETDHAPLLPMFQNPNSKPPMRIERWLTYLQQFSFTLTYRPGSENGADYLSRHPVPTCDKDIRISKNREETVCALIKDTTPKAISLAEIQKATAEDTTLQALIPLIMSSDHNACKRNKLTMDYRNVFHELSVIEQLVLRDNRIVLPKSMWQRAIDISHEGHFGIVKTKQLLRSKIWFPGIDRMVEATIANCIPCQAYTDSTRREPLKMSKTPPGPWIETCMDFCGPFPDGSMLLVWIDDYSRYPEVEFVPSTSAQNVIPAMEKIIATHGIPTVIKSDNGSPFNGHSFAEFCKEKDIKHRRITPLWPEANGLAEVFMKSIKKLAQTSTVEGKNWKVELYKMLGNYRSTPHPNTGYSPRYLCLGRKGKTKLPELEPKQDQHFTEIETRDQAVKEKNKNYADKKRNTRTVDYQVNDFVLIKQNKTNKLSTTYEPMPYQIVKVNNSMITARRVSDHRMVTRNSSCVKKICESEYDYDDSESMCEFDGETNELHNVSGDTPEIDAQNEYNEREEMGNIPHIVQNAQSEETARTRSGRVVTKPTYLNDYVP